MEVTATIEDDILMILIREGNTEEIKIRIKMIAVDGISAEEVMMMMNVMEEIMRDEEVIEDNTEEIKIRIKMIIVDVTEVMMMDVMEEITRDKEEMTLANKEEEAITSNQRCQRCPRCPRCPSLPTSTCLLGSR
jgi:predicted RecB family nuclease